MKCDTVITDWKSPIMTTRECTCAATKCKYIVTFNLELSTAHTRAHTGTHTHTQLLNTVIDLPKKEFALLVCPVPW